MKKLLYLLLFIVLAMVGVAYYFTTGSYSEGFRAGTVIKLSRKGVVFKTYEGQLNLGMVLSEGSESATHAEVSNLWEFSVLRGDSKVREDLERVMLSGRRAKLHYEEKYLKLPWRGDTRYLVTEFEMLPEDARPRPSEENGPMEPPKVPLVEPAPAH
jgi:hypothetical protein